MRDLAKSFTKIYYEHACLLGLYYWPSRGKEKKAVICMNDLDRNHAEKERVCSEFQDVSLN